MTILKTNTLAGPGGTTAIDGSVFFDETSYLALASGALISGYGFGVDDFTVEFWIKQGINSGNYVGLFTLTSSTSADRFEVAIHSSTIQVYTDTGAWRDTSYAPVSGQWEHIAFVRNYSGNTLKMYANGVEKWSVSNTHDYNEVFTTQIGFHGSSYPKFKGCISNLRVLKGIALYTAAFTPPTEKLTAVPGTILLCCQDSDDPTQEATGKTITGYGRYFAATGELFANTGFTADSDWTKGSGWTISGGLATHAQGSAGDLYQAVSGLVVGQTYKISVDIISTDNDVAYFYIDNDPGGNYPLLTPSQSSPVGYHFLYFDANATTMNIGFRGSSLFAGTITNLRLSSADHGKAPKIIPPVGTDAGTVLEGDITFDSLNYMTLPKGTTQERGRGTRGVFMGAGGVTPAINTMDYINIQSTAHALDFGDATSNWAAGAAASSSTRGLHFAGFISPAESNVIDYITIATTGNAADFGDLTQGRRNLNAFSSQTRGIAAGGTTQSPAVKQNVIDYVTIATLGNATDFGDLQNPVSSDPTGFSSPTRGIIAGGEGNSPLNNGINVIDYVTIASTGNAADFGDLTTVQSRGDGTSSNIRGVIYSGKRHPTTYSNTIDYITIATTGNAKDFGDAETAINNCAATSNCLRGVFGGGYVPGANTNAISYMSLQSSGNSLTFGDLTVARREFGACSDGHGGLS